MHCNALVGPAVPFLPSMKTLYEHRIYHPVKLWAQAPHLRFEAWHGQWAFKQWVIGQLGNWAMGNGHG